MMRRRQILAGLLATTLVTVVVGAAPGLHVAWDVALASFLLTTGYVALLVRSQQSKLFEEAARERALKVVPLYPLRTSSSTSPESDRHAVTAETEAVPTMTRRPAFVLVDVQG